LRFSFCGNQFIGKRSNKSAQNTQSHRIFGKKSYFNILDYTGSATRLFADPDFDGEPTLISEEQITDDGKVIPTTYQVVVDTESQVHDGVDAQPVFDDAEETPRRKFYFDGGKVEIAAHLVYELDGDGKQLRVVKFTDYTAQTVRTLYPSAIELRNQWADPDKRAEIIQRLEERGLDFEQLAAMTGQPNADPFDLLCHVAFNLPIRTRRERADGLKKEHREFFEQFQPEARAILEDLLEKYSEHGTLQFTMPDVLKVPPISERGNPMEIAHLFGGPERLRTAVNQLQSMLYAS